MILMPKEYTRLPGALVIAGQNSLSVYVFQGVVIGFVFGGHSLGLFNRFGFAEHSVIGLLITGVSFL